MQISTCCSSHRKRTLGLMGSECLCLCLQYCSYMGLHTGCMYQCAEWPQSSGQRVDVEHGASLPPHFRFVISVLSICLPMGCLCSRLSVHFYSPHTHTHVLMIQRRATVCINCLHHSLILPQRRGSCRHFCNAARSCTAQSHLCVHRHAEGPHPEVEE